MKSGERYIIEIDTVVDGLAKIKGFNALVFDENGLNKLEKVGNNYFSRDKVNEEKEFSYRNGKNVGYSEGYDKGFKDGVKHQESTKPTEIHVPQEGDVYRDSLGQAFVIYNIEGTQCNRMYNDGSGHTVKIEDLKALKHVGNIKADLEAFQKVVGSYE